MIRNPMRRSILSAKLVALLLAASSLAVPAHAQNLPSLGDTEREELSPTMERRLGEQIMRDIRRDRDYLDDEPVLEYLNNFGASLLAVAPEARGEAGYDFFFFAVRDPMLNAFALPGGFIGVHSGLVLAAQNESELASVVSHEIGHVSQRHIARMLGRQRQDALIPLASMVLAALAARSSPDAAGALMLGGQGVALQRQLGFSRDAEREADRVGLEILRGAGYDTTGMMSFFNRVQTASRAYSDTAPAYLRSHPLTTERMADIEARTRGQRYKQRADSLDFHLVRARLRVLQDLSSQGLRDTAAIFESQLQQKTRTQIASAKYGLAYIAMHRGTPAKARALYQEAQAAASQGASATQSVLLTSLGIEIRLAASEAQEALQEAEAAKTKFPLSRSITRQYADALIAAGRVDDAVTYLRDQAQLYRTDPKLQDQLARAYSAQGKQALQHLALAESYAINGILPAAIEQLNIARRAPDANYYDQAVIDAREREFKMRFAEEMKEAKER